MEAFAQYLIDRGLIPASVGRKLAERNYIREPIGMIAVGHGILTPMQIDMILDRQRECRDKFGEIAVAMGVLTQEQVDVLIKIQEFRTSSEISEALALAQVLSIEDAAKYLGSFLLRDRELVSMVSDN